MGSDFKGGREEVDLNECGEGRAVTVLRELEPAEGLKSWQQLFSFLKNQ